jgi:hypothetical protein
MRVKIIQCYPDRDEIQNVTIAFAVDYLSNYKVWKEDTILDLLLEGFEFSTPNGAEYVKLINN